MQVDASHPAGNFRRTIYHASVGPLEGQLPETTEQLLVLHIRGSAFLWHQVRQAPVIPLTLPCLVPKQACCPSGL